MVSVLLPLVWCYYDNSLHGNNIFAFVIKRIRLNAMCLNILIDSRIAVLFEEYKMKYSNCAINLLQFVMCIIFKHIMEFYPNV